MKLKAFVFATLLSVFPSAFAQVFPLVLPLQVTVRVVNPYPHPVICNGQVFGRTAYGAVLTTFFTNQYILPGTDRLAFVQTTPMNPFIHGWTNIYCY
jgi:hypothetical protein